MSSQSQTIESTVRGSGNVFRDFGYANADVLQLKSQLAARIIGVLDGQGMTVRRAEVATGIAASDFSRIRNAKLDRFTIDRLMTILSRLDQQIEVSITTRPRGAATPSLDATTAATTRAFLDRLKGRYVVKESILFGSRARQTHRDDSDADLVVVLAGKSGNRSKAGRDLAGIAFDVMMDTGVLVEALPLFEGELEHPERFSNPALIRNIQREGLRL